MSKNIAEIKKNLALLDKYKVKYHAYKDDKTHLKIDLPNSLNIKLCFWPGTGRWGCQKSDDMKVWINKKGYSGYDFESMLHFINFIKKYESKKKKNK